MKINATLPQVTPHFTIGSTAAVPPAAPPAFVELEVSKWVHARAIADGSTDPYVFYSDAWGIDDMASGEATGGEGGAIVALKWLRFWAERADGTTAAIAAHWARLVCGLVTVSVTVDAAANTLTFAEPHGLRANDIIRLSAGTYPGGTAAATDYFAIIISETAVSISATKGGSAIDITNAGATVLAVLGEVEIARLYIPAAAANTVLEAPPFTVIHPAGSRRFSAGTGSSPVYLRRSSRASDASVQYHIQLAGD